MIHLQLSNYGRVMQHYKWLPVIDAELCDGCQACVEACNPACLELASHVVALARPDVCGSEEHCIEPCQTGAISMQWVSFKGDILSGRWK